MTDSPLENATFPHLKGYGAYLLASCLEEATLASLAYAEKIKLPLLTLLAHAAETDQHTFVKQSLKTFFEQLAAGNALAHTKENLLQGSANTLPNIPWHGVDVSDLVLSFHARKQVLIGLLPGYTTDAARLIALVQELDVLFAEVERFAFALFVNLKREEHEAFNLLLQEEQVKLEEAYEEIRASREDVQGTNHSLSQEVSRRRLAEKALAHERNFLKAILENISDGIVACNAEGVLSYFNPATRSFHGLPEQPLPADQWSSYYHLYLPDGLTPMTKEDIPLFRAFQGEILSETEMVIARADGSQKVLLAKGQPIRSASGKIEGAVVVMHDITELKQAQQLQKESLQQLHAKNSELETALANVQAAEAALLAMNNALEDRIQERTRELQTSRSQLYNLFMQAPALLCIVRGPELVFELANAPYLKVIGATESVIGKPFKEVIPDVDAGILALLAGVMNTGQSFVGREVPMQADWERNGNVWTKYFNFIYDPLYDADGTIGGIIGFGYDVTDHVQARRELEDTALLMQEVNEELRLKNAELNKINNDLDNFVYTASHDLRSPVVNLEGLVMALKKQQEKPDSHDPRALIGMMETSISKLNRTIRDLTEITKAQKGLEEAREKVSIRTVLEDIKADLHTSIAEAQPVFIEKLQVESITYAPRNLRSILYNLLTNALKYRSDRRLEISISTYRDGEYVVLCIQDNGLGLSEKQLPKLFSMFKRMHTHVEGTGIGLYIIKRIVENSGGKIEVSSELHQGTRFAVYLATNG
jgi:PAS domain S-box-containing protein